MARKKRSDMYCPEECPDLETPALRDVNSLPHFCERFSCFLGIDGSDRVLRCEDCSGCPRGLKNIGLDLISSIRHPNLDIVATKKAFACLSPKDQQRYVYLLLVKGPALGLPKSTVKSGTPEMWAQTLAQMLDVQEDIVRHAPSPQAAVASFLGTPPGSLPDFMTPQVCQLLQNLLGILDNTERYWMREVLSNKEGMSQFVKKMKDMPKGKSFVANVRRELEDAFKKEIIRQKEAEHQKSQQTRQALFQRRNQQREL